jgi:NhaC family Na+:H+ antiporter
LQNSNDIEWIQKFTEKKNYQLEALIPVAALVAMLSFNVYVYGDEALSVIICLLLGAAVAAIVGF